MARRPATDFIVVHCSWSKADQDWRAIDLDRMHRERGWNGIGYHFVIGRDGRLEAGRKLENRGAHVRGFNDRSIGVCLIGGMGPDGGDQDNFTGAQRGTLAIALMFLRKLYPDAKIVGHTDLDPGKTCPVMDLDQYLQTLRHWLERWA